MNPKITWKRIRQGKKVPKIGKICTIFDLIYTIFENIETKHKNKVILPT